MFSRHSIICAALSVGILSSLLGGCTSTQPAGLSMPPAAVKLQTIQLEPVDQVSTFMGNVKSRRSALLQPRVSGTISRILVTAGQQVGKGTPLVEIDPEKERQSVESLSSATQSMQADRESAVQTLHSLEATRTSKQANLAYLQKEVQRYTWLSNQGAVAKETVDNYVMQSHTAEGDLKSIEAQIEAQKLIVAKNEHLIKQTDYSARGEREQLKFYTISAPFDGTVGDIPFRVGEYVDSTAKITSVTENAPLEVYLSVPAEKAGGLKQNMLVKLNDSTGNQIGEATVIFISPLTEDSQTVTVKATYPNSDRKLRSNQTVTAQIVWNRADGIKVPTFAVAHISGQDFVFVSQGHGNTMVAKQKPVELGDIVGGGYVVKSGLSVGEQVITSGVQNLIDGAPIAPQS